MRSVSTVLFDWDGTLSNSFPVIRRASFAVFAHFGIEMDDDRYHATHQCDWHETYRQLGIPESAWDEAKALWWERYREGSAEVTLFPEVPAVLGELEEAGLRLGVVTSADHARLLADLNRAGLDGRFETLVAFEHAERKKPHPEALLLALDRLGVEPGAALYAGDRPEDIEMGRRAGTRTAAVVSDFATEAALRAARPDVLLRRIADLPAALSRDR